MPADRIVVGMSLWKTIAICLIGLVMVSAGLFVACSPLILKSNGSILPALFTLLLGTTGIWFSGCILAALLKALIKGEPVVVIDDDGFSLSAGSLRQPERVRWKDVQDIGRVTYNYSSAVVVKLTDEAHARRTRSL